jgi:hypothetical protein
MVDTTPAEPGEGYPLALESMAPDGLAMERDIGLEPTTFS